VYGLQLGVEVMTKKQGGNVDKKSEPVVHESADMFVAILKLKSGYQENLEKGGTKKMSDLGSVGKTQGELGVLWVRGKVSPEERMVGGKSSKAPEVRGTKSGGRKDHL